MGKEGPALVIVVMMVNSVRVVFRQEVCKVSVDGRM